MAGNTFLQRDPTTQLPKEIAGTQISAGGANANQIPALNASGVFDISLMPTGVGSNALTFPASESLSAGAMVNIWSNAGVASARNASAADATKPAVGFVIGAVSSGATALVYFPGADVTGLTGLTIGDRIFLGVTAGSSVGSASTPTAAGNLVQQVGTALSTTSFTFNPSHGIIHG